MNKKAYSAPRTRVAELDMELLIAQSAPSKMKIDDSVEVDNTSDVWAKEDKNLWDTEW